MKSNATGHYVPQLAEMVYERNKHVEANQRINLKGFIVSTKSHLIFVFVFQNPELICNSRSLYGTIFDRLAMQRLMLTMTTRGYLSLRGATR